MKYVVYQQRTGASEVFESFEEAEAEASRRRGKTKIMYLVEMDAGDLVVNQHGDESRMGWLTDDVAVLITEGGLVGVPLQVYLREFEGPTE